MNKITDAEKELAVINEVFRRGNIPPRYPYGDPRNIDRIKIFNQEYNKVKRQLTSRAYHGSWKEVIRRIEEKGK